jgi:hypothetical protein
VAEVGGVSEGREERRHPVARVQAREGQVLFDKRGEGRGKGT